MASKKRSISATVTIWTLWLLWLLISWISRRIYYAILRKYFPDMTVEAPSNEEYQDFYKTARWVRLARKIKKRYREWDFVHFMWVHRCMRCGKSDQSLSQPIHVDHIKSVWFHWHIRLDPENLQLLCAGCNRIKGSHDMTDYRGSRYGKPVCAPVPAPIPVYAKKPLALPPPRNEGRLVEDKKRKVYRPARPKNYNTAAALSGAYHHLPPMEPG